MKPQLKFLCLILVLIIFTKAKAQMPKASLSGTVMANATPLELAYVQLFNTKDSALVKMEVTDEKGVFTFNQLAKGNYTILVSHIQYQSQSIRNIEVALDNVTIEPIVLINVKGNLKEVTVVGQKKYIEKKADRLIINPDALISNDGLNVMEVLEKSPGVRVDENSTISLRGKQGVNVFIDNRPTYLTGEGLSNFLKGLPSGAVKQIELITNPPAQYDAQGSAGIINIVLKKNTVKGFNGGITSSYRQGQRARFNNTAFLNYRVNKVNMFGNIAYNNNKQFQDLTIKRSYLNSNGDATTQLNQHSFINEHQGGFTAKVGADYYMNSKSVLGFTVSHFNNFNNTNTPSNTALNDNVNNSDSFVFTQSNGYKGWQNANVNINYAYTFDSTGKNIAINADYLNYKADIAQTLYNATFFGNNLITQNGLKGNLPADINVYAVKADYVHPLPNNQKVDVGVKTSMVMIDNEALFRNDNNEVNYDLSNKFLYDENISAAYINYAREWAKNAIQIGLRYEHTQLSGNQTGNPFRKDSTFDRNYGNLFPTLFVNHKFDSLDKHQVSFSAGYRINRPNYQDLNPFFYPLDKFSIYGGNPFLRPTFAYNTELTYSLSNKYFTTLSYSYVSNVISETIQLEGNLFFSRPGNIGTQQSYVLSFSGSFNPAKPWVIQCDLEGGHNAFSGNIYNQRLNNSGFYGASNVINQFVLGKNWFAEMIFVGQTTVNSAQFITIPNWRTGVAVQKKFWKNKASVKLNFTDVFYSFRSGGEILALQQAGSTFYSRFDSRTFIVSLSYNFKSGQSLRGRNSGGADEEKSRIKT